MRSSEVERTIPTAMGDARVVTAPAARAARAARAAQDALTLVLGHGAGGGIEARDLVAIAQALPARGVTVVRVVQPWRVAGRRVAGLPPTLDRAWLDVLAALDVQGDLVVGGRSAGARVACRTALKVAAAGCLALAFPLHPPGRPEKSRLEELLGAGVPTLVVQGEQDAFGGPAEFARRPSPFAVQRVPGADHSFRVATSADQRAALDGLVEGVATWLASLSGTRR